MRAAVSRRDPLGKLRGSGAANSGCAAPHGRRNCPRWWGRGPAAGRKPVTLMGRISPVTDPAKPGATAARLGSLLRWPLPPSGVTWSPA